MSGTGVNVQLDGAGELRASTRDSVTVALWTAVSRATGLVRVAVIAAVLGPTYLGNTYQFTNSVPNLVYYGLLGGALVSSLLVPTLVKHLAAGSSDTAASVACGFFGCAVAAAAVVVPVLVAVVPFVLRATTGAGALAGTQRNVATWLVIMLAPQIVCYAVIACSVAAMNARRRFAVAAAAPTIENVGSLLVLGLVWVRYGTGREVTDVGPGEIALLGIGTTAAVVLHAAVQWAGARRSGITLIPRRGWRDPQVRAVAARGGFAIAQAGLWAVQLLVATALANRLAGGVVAILIATNFFFLPIALGATPIALSVLPRLAGQIAAGRSRDAADSIRHAVSLTIFITVPAVAGYLVLAPRLARLVTFGSMDGAGARDLIVVSLAAIAPGIVGTGLFTVATYVCYAYDDARTPLRAMTVQAMIAVPVMIASVGVTGPASLAVVTGGLALGGLIGAALLVRRLVGPAGWFGSLRRSAGCALVMVAVVWLCDRGCAALLSSRGGQIADVGVSVLVGAAVYAIAHRVVRSPELAVLASSLRRPAAALAGPLTSPEAESP